MSKKPIPIAISARHVHLSREDIDKLFGKDHQLTPLRPLSQPGQYASEETVDVVGPKGEIKKVRVLGPERSKTQVEVSRTDERQLGIDAPIRESGDLEGTPGIKLRTDKGEVDIPEGVIQAKRHIHMHPDDAKEYGVKDKDIVEVKVDSDGRDLTFGDVVIRVSPNFKLEMHVDTDEGNAAEINPDTNGQLEYEPAKGAAIITNIHHHHHHHEHKNLTIINP